MMMSSSSVSEETPHPTISVTDGSCNFSMFWKAEEQREPHLPPSLQVKSQDFQQQGWGFKSCCLAVAQGLSAGSWRKRSIFCFLSSNSSRGSRPPEPLLLQELEVGPRSRRWEAGRGRSTGLKAEKAASHQGETLSRPLEAQGL